MTRKNTEFCCNFQTLADSGLSCFLCKSMFEVISRNLYWGILQRVPTKIRKILGQKLHLKQAPKHRFGLS